MNRIDHILTLDRFLIRPGHLSGYRRYNIWDKKGDPVLLAECRTNPPLRLFRLVLGIALGVGAFLVAAMVLPEKIPEHFRLSLQLMVFLVVLIGTSVALCERYGTIIYREGPGREVYLQILQKNRIPIPHIWYTVKGENGLTIARIRRNAYYRLFLSRWYLYREDDRILGYAKDDSVVRSLLTRLIGTRLPMLRANYKIFDGKTGNILGEFNRRRLVFGCYVLDMDSDYRRVLDRRIALALAVLIDLGDVS